MPPPPPRAARRSRAWPLLPLAPALVLLLGMAVAVAIAVYGMNAISVENQDQTRARAALFADTLAARLWHTPETERLEVMRHAQRRTDAQFVVVTRDGEIVLDASYSPMDQSSLREVVAQQDGQAIVGGSLTRFAARPLGPPPYTLFLAVFTREPETPEVGPALARALFALTTLLVGVAAIVAYAVGRDAQRDVDLLARRVRDMFLVRSEPAGETVPVRTIDATGALASAFNDLVERFAAAEKKYKDDLERVRAADRDRSAFLAAVSHELRSPLNAILGFAEILLTEVDGPLTPASREEVEQIRGSGQHLLNLINDILEFSALESGQLKLARARVDLVALAEEVVREASATIGTRPVRLRIEGLANVAAHADPKRIRQVLTNLVANAVKFTAEGEVVISIGWEGRYARVSVRDTGPGIGDAERAVIFEEYKQTREERRKKRGTGLGLAIARRLVLMHAGTIQVESEVGQGSTFNVLLPAWTGQSSKPPKARRSEAAR